MPARNKLPFIKRFPLVKTDAEFENTDPNDPTIVEIRQAGVGEHDRRNQQWNIVNHEYSTLGETVKQTIDYGSLKILEVYLTMASCNFLKADGTEMFKFKDGRLDMTETAFREAWNSISSKTVTDEIHACVLEQNPTWKTSGN